MGLSKKKWVKIKVIKNLQNKLKMIKLKRSKIIKLNKSQEKQKTIKNKSQ